MTQSTLPLSIVERAENPQAGDRYDKHGKTVVVDEVTENAVKWSYMGGNDYSEHVSDMAEWRRLARKAIDQGALFTPIKNGVKQAAVCCENTRKDQADWPERAYDELLHFARVTFQNWGREWTAEDATNYIISVCGEPHDKRATGHFLRAQREKLIERGTETYRRANGHGSIALKWRTL